MKNFFHARKALLAFSMMALAGFQTGTALNVKGIRGTICVDSLSAGLATFGIKEGDGFSLLNTSIFIPPLILDKTSFYNTLEMVTGVGNVVKEANILLDVNFKKAFKAIPTVTLMPQNKTGGTFVIINPANPAQIAIVLQTAFALRGNATKTGFTASSVITVAGNNSDWVTAVMFGLLRHPLADGPIGPFPQDPERRFCLHFQALEEVPA